MHVRDKRDFRENRLSDSYFRPASERKYVSSMFIDRRGWNPVQNVQADAMQETPETNWVVAEYLNVQEEQLFIDFQYGCRKS